jgi:hypothetical protein
MGDGSFAIAYLKRDAGRPVITAGRLWLGSRPLRGQGRAWRNGIKLRWYRHQPEDDLRERGQQGRLAGLAGLVPAAGAFGLALVAAARASWHEVAVEGDLEGQVGGELVKPVRGKSFRGR